MRFRIFVLKSQQSVSYLITVENWFPSSCKKQMYNNLKPAKLTLYHIISIYTLCDICKTKDLTLLYS